MRAELRDDVLAVASNDGSGTEMCYMFRRCMNNKLFTFSHVGRRAVAGRDTSSTAGVTTGAGITWLNLTGSDNIGPVGVQGYPDFVGGNHPWREPDSLGNPGRGGYSSVRTATCDSVTITVDGVRLLDGHSRRCRQVVVDVWNTLMDPFVAPDSGAVALPCPLIIEHVTYTLQGNSIAVDLEHRYRRDFTVSRYYGMQSMFVGEEQIMLPGGACPEWQPRSSVGNMTKGDYPDFARFLEMDANGWLQSSWLRHTGLGNHEGLGAASPIYVHAHPKSYDVLLDKCAVLADSANHWSGIYTWALPLANNSALLAYSGVIDGKEVIYIDTKRECDHYSIEVPENWPGFRLIGHNGAIRIAGGTRFIHVTAPTAASALVARTPYGDLTLDGTVDVSDINAAIMLALSADIDDSVLKIADLNNDNAIDVSDVNSIITLALSQ
ncbi:MAG: dockerin type I repeat-containing protein [Muribaculaceae bacterium]|nr:dockerin type I repeat-containing protein [Muribaculaceae bacterium]